MSDFINIKNAVRQQMDYLSQFELFRVDVDKDLMWETYLGSFREGTNPVFRERTEHDCRCCKQFIRAAGNIVAIVDNQLVSIWDIDIADDCYQIVANSLSELVKSKPVCDVMRSTDNHLGTDYNHQSTESGDIVKWSHFHFKIPEKFIAADVGSLLSNIRATKEVFKRGLDEISIDAMNTVIELIEQKSLYRGDEFLSAVETFLMRKKAYDSVPVYDQDNYCWHSSSDYATRVRNTAIGTLLVDVSAGMDLDAAVGSFEAKVAPQNYKRPSALITKSMIANAQKKVEDLGITDSLQRRHAVVDDITINNVLFADRASKKVMNVFDEMSKTVPDRISNLDKVDEVDIGTFIESILPKAEALELMVENNHSGNFMSLIAPVEPDATPLFKWGNNFSWAYNGEVADSMKERVKKAGGDVTGVLRFSIQWNDGDDNQNDFDAHCIEPDGNLISYPSAGRSHPSSGKLDVDIQTPGRNVAVENITWSNKRKMQEGIYQMLVHNYSHNDGRTGFTAEIEYDSVVYSYSYDKNLRQGEKVDVAAFCFNKKEGIEFVRSLPSSQSSKEIWGVNTHKFHKVSMVMNSPNHWDGHTTGNKHLFFILDGCKNDKKVRGFFNEFLKDDLHEHRKVFEVLGSKTKAEVSDNQLSGLGFSSTQRNHVLCKVSGSFNRVIKINF